MISPLLPFLIDAQVRADMLLAATRRPVGGAESGGQLLLWLLIAGVIIAAVCGAMTLGQRWHHQRSHHSHAALFTGLCAAHGLDRPACRLLARVGRYHRLAQPARLFTEPEWLEPAGLGSGFSERSEQITALRTRLFAETALKAS